MANDGKIISIQSLLVNGAEHVETVETEIGDFEYRPLTKGERDQIKAVKLRGIVTSAKATKMEGIENMSPNASIDVDLEKMSTAEDEAFNLTLAYGLSVKDKIITVDDIKKLAVKNEILNIVFKAINEISGIGEDDLRPFLKKNIPRPESS